MRPFLLVIPVILLVLLNACGGNGTAVEQTTTVWTPIPSPSPTFDPIASLIFYELNMAIEEMETSNKFNELEHITGASYQVINIGFPQEQDGTVSFRLDVRCECTLNAQCCSPTRTFVVTLMAINNMRYFEEIKKQVPETVSQMEVWIYDHGDLTDVILIRWDQTKLFFDGYISGFQLASQVTPIPQP